MTGSNESAALVAGLVDDMLGDVAPSVVSQAELADEEAGAREYLAPKPQTRPQAGGSAAAIANVVRNVSLPAREFPHWTQQHEAVDDVASIEQRARSMFAPANSPEARERRLLRTPAVEAPKAPAARGEKPAPARPAKRPGLPADELVGKLTPAQFEALEQAVLDRRAAEYEAQEAREAAEAEAQFAEETVQWLTEIEETPDLHAEVEEEAVESEDGEVE